MAILSTKLLKFIYKVNFTVSKLSKNSLKIYRSKRLFFCRLYKQNIHFWPKDFAPAIAAHYMLLAAGLLELLLGVIR